MALTTADEYLHAPPEGHDGLWSDNFWFSVVDREADVFGINHIHASRSHGYLRASAMYVVDGEIKVMQISEAADELAGDARPEASCVENMLKLIGEL